MRELVRPPTSATRSILPRKPSAADAVAANLIDWIASARFPLHSRLPPERVLCQQLGVGRATLRHALLSLEAQGRIWRHVGKGTFVGGRPASVLSDAIALSAEATLPEMLEVRMMVEPTVARLAAVRASAADLVLIEKYHRQAARASDWGCFVHWDELFHRGLAEAGGNALMISIIDHLFRIKRNSRWCITRARKFDPTLRRRYAAHHDEIVSAVCDRDGDEAEAAMRRHVESIARTTGPALA